MMKLLPILAAAMMSQAAAMGESVLVTENNINDLNPQRDQTNLVEGAAMITHTMTDGVRPISLGNVTTIQLRVVRDIDKFTNVVTAAFVTNSPGTVRWYVTNLLAGSYQASSTIYYQNANTPVFDRYLTVTSSQVQQSITVNDPTSFGAQGVTGTPHHVEMWINGTLATGVLNGANMAMYWTVTDDDDYSSFLTNGGFTINGSPVSNGASFTISGGADSGITFTTNSYGVVGHTNAYGVFIPVAGSMYPPGTPYIARTFEAPYTITNLNQGNWSAIITNGMLVVTADSNSVTQVRIFGNEPIPTGVNVGVCVRLKAAPILRDASDHYYFGLAGGLATNSTYYGINIVGNNSEGNISGQNGAPGAGIATTTGNESATMLASLGRTLSQINIDGRRIWLVFDWNPTTRLLRQGIARDNDGIPFYPYQLQGTTNFSSDITQAGIWLTQRTISKVPMQWAFDDFLIYTNLMFP